jgi:hypothetical protein
VTGAGALPLRILGTIVSLLLADEGCLGAATSLLKLRDSLTQEYPAAFHQLADLSGDIG